MVQYNLKNETTDPIKGRSYVYDLHYRLVWVIKYRYQALTPEIQEALKDKLLAIAKDNELTIEAMGIMPNHVHLLVSAKPRISVTVIIKKLKGIAGKWLFEQFPKLRKNFWHGHIWSSSYYVESVGQTIEGTIERYIKSQKERPFE